MSLIPKTINLPNPDLHRIGQRDADVSGYLNTLNDVLRHYTRIVKDSLDGLNTLTDDSMADALHRHSELSGATDGTPNPVLAVDTSGVTKIGTPGGTDYIQIAADGEITLAGTARVTKHLYVPISGGAGANNPTVRTTEAPYLSWTFAVNDDDHHSLPVPHDMDYTQPMNVYVEWYTTDANASGVDEVNWQLQWASRAVGETVNAGSTTDTSGDIVCSAQYVIVNTLVETIPGSSFTADDIIGMDLTRIAIVDGTNPAVGKIHVLSWHIEYTSNKLGEAT